MDRNNTKNKLGGNILKTNKSKNYFWIYLFLLPSFVLFIVFFLVPILTVLLTSFTKWDGFNPPEFAGFDNYLKAFKSSEVKESVVNLGLWSIIAAVGHVGFGVIVALVLNERMRGWKLTRAVFMIPNVISMVAWALIYQFMFRNDIGIVNTVLRKFNATIDINWFHDNGYAFVAVTSTWFFFAVIVTLLVMGDLLAIPRSLHEAAHIDGTSRWRQIWLIDLPLCRNAIGTSVIASITSRIAMYESVKLTTNGAAGTMSLSLVLTKNLMGSANYGYANTIGVIMIIFGLVTLFFVNKLFKMDENIY